MKVFVDSRPDRALSRPHLDPILYFVINLLLLVFNCDHVTYGQTTLPVTPPTYLQDNLKYNVNLSLVNNRQYRNDNVPPDEDTEELDDQLDPNEHSEPIIVDDTIINVEDDFCHENYVDSAYYNGYDTILTRGDRLWYYYKDKHRLSKAFDQRKFTQGKTANKALLLFVLNLLKLFFDHIDFRTIR